jgi:hypothetical protein
MAPGDALFSRTTQRLLAALFAEPGQESLTYSEILRRTSGGSGAIHREIGRLLAAGLVVQAAGPAGRTFAPNRAHPWYEPLHAMARTLVARPGGGALEPKLARALARKYLWWLDPDEAVRQPDRLVAQVMNMGTFEDARTIEGQLGEAFLRGVLERAAPGWFDERPWTFWHYRLGLAKPGRVPDPPRRRFG